MESKYILILILLLCGACAKSDLDDIVTLQEAMKKNDLDIIEQYSRSGTTANLRIHRNRAVFTSPLIVAAENANLYAVKRLIEAGADINVTNSSGETPLIRTMLFDSHDSWLQVARRLLESGADVNAKDVNGSDALHNAVAYREPEFVRLLLEAGADPKAVDLRGNTALHRAGSVTNVSILLNAGVDPLRTNHAGQSALDVARERKRAAVAQCFEQEIARLRSQ